MYNHNKAQQSKNRVHISWDILYNINHITVNWELGDQEPIVVQYFIVDILSVVCGLLWYV